MYRRTFRVEFNRFEVAVDRLLPVALSAVFIAFEIEVMG